MNSTTLITISKAAKLLGVTTKTLREWERVGKLSPIRTDGGHRRYKLDELLGSKAVPTGVTVGYARVSSNGQKNDLARQSELLSLYCASKGYQFLIIEDMGSGLDYKKKGLTRLIKMICTGQLDRLVITQKDRLLRFGSELIFSLCENFGVEVNIINKGDSTPEEDLTTDVLEIITVFSARLYGSRSHKNKTIMEKLRNIEL